MVSPSDETPGRDVWHTPGLDDPLGGSFEEDPTATPRVHRYGPAFVEAGEPDVDLVGSTGSRRVRISSSSYTAASKHVQTHGVTKDNLQVALAFAHRVEGNRQRRVHTYMRQVPFETRTAMWKQHLDAVARWVASDTIGGGVEGLPGDVPYCPVPVPVWTVQCQQTVQRSCLVLYFLRLFFDSLFVHTGSHYCVCYK